MKISEVARRSGVSPSRIRFYETRGLLPPAERALNGYRVYAKPDVGALQLIANAKTLGFSLREIAAVIPKQIDGALSPDLAVQLLERRLVAVDAHIASLVALRDRIVQLVDAQRSCAGPAERREGETLSSLVLESDPPSPVRQRRRTRP